MTLLGRVLRRFRYGRLRREFAEYTMIQQPAFRQNLELAYLFRHVPGAVVECGVWRGGMSAALSKVVGKDRAYYLFDSFEGLPPPKQEDGEQAIAWSKSKSAAFFYDNCRADKEIAARAMQLAGVKNATLVKGWFDQTLPQFNFAEPIAILRLDGDWYDSTMCCLTHLYDKVTRGGVILIDDYLHWEGCSRAVHDFLSQRKSPEVIQCFGEVAYLVKR
jgi:O-methyltransferase